MKGHEFSLCLQTEAGHCSPGLSAPPRCSPRTLLSQEGWEEAVVEHLPEASEVPELGKVVSLHRTTDGEIRAWMSPLSHRSGWILPGLTSDGKGRGGAQGQLLFFYPGDFVGTLVYYSALYCLLVFQAAPRS